MQRLIFVTVSLSMIAACGKKGDAPTKPATGAPVALTAKDVTPGEHYKGSIKIDQYNFSDKRVAGYAVMIRFKDAGGAVVKVNAGTPLEKDFATTSYTGKKYSCDPQSWCSYTIDGVTVPAKAATAEVLATRVSSLKDDVHFDDQPLFDLSAMEWPADKTGA